MEYIVFVILIVTLVLFIWGRWRFDVVACMALMATLLVGAVPFSHAFTGFSNPAVITVAAVMVISQAITNSGILDHLVKHIAPVTGKVWLHVAVLSVIAAVLSAFMNNVGALALLMPVAIQTSIKCKRSPSLILMPIAFSSILGGMTTLIGTPPNILISAYRQQVLGASYDMFDFAPVGVVVAIVGVIYIIFVGWRLIPRARSERKVAEDVFQIQDYVTEVRIPETSPWVGQCLHDLESMDVAEFMILGLIRNNHKRLKLPGSTQFKAEDILIIEASSAELEKIITAGKLELVASKDLSSDLLSSEDVGVIEAAVMPQSKIEGHTPQRMQLRSRYGINLLAIAREGEAFRQRLKNVKLKAGDVLLLQGNAESLVETVAEIGFLPLAERGIRVGLPSTMWLPASIFFVALALAVSKLLPVEIAFAGAVLAMVVFNAIPIRKVYESIDWAVIVLLGAMLPVGKALETTGGTQLIADWIVSSAGQMAPIYILGIVLIVTMALTDVINNAATALIMAPIAATIAQTLGYSIDPFLMSVAVGASCAFLTPIGHQNNTIVMGPGGYHFGDYWRMGLPLDVFIIATSLPMILWVWPLN